MNPIKSWCFVLFLISFTGVYYSQVNAIDWSLDNRRKSTLLDIFPDKGFNFYAFRVVGNGILQANKVSRYMYGEEITSKKIENRVDGNTATLESMMTFNGTLL
jgi:hypothetical protein